MPPAKAIVITGASTGIGAACARHLDRLGFRVYAGVRRHADGDRLTETASNRLVPMLLDVTSQDSIDDAARFVDGEVKDEGLWGLVNNAGIAVGGPLEFLPIADLRRQLDVNVIGQVAVTQAFLGMIRRGRGRIVNMGSIAGRSAMPIMGAYSASKYALEALTDALRLELQQWGIRVSIVEPGAIATPIWEKSVREADRLEASANPEAKALYAEAIAGVRQAVARAAARAIAPDAVADAVAHALTSPSPKTRYLVGRDAKLRAFLRALLSDSVQDAVLTWALRLPKSS